VGLDSIGSDPWTTAVLEPGDHSGDDARSLCFTTGPLADDWELTGPARAVLPVRASVAGLHHVVKLCDVSAEGRSRLVAVGWAPGPGTGTVEVGLRPTAHVFRRGHRIRLGLALADFPRLWPAPQAGEVVLNWSVDGAPRLLLPRTPPGAMGAPDLPPAAEGVRSSLELESSQSWRLCRELVQGTAELESRSASAYRLRDGGTVSYRHEYTAGASAAGGAAIDCRSSVEARLADRVVLVRTTSRFTPASVTIEAEVEWDGESFFRRRWEGGQVSGP
jgi:hypothetical protein